MKPGEDIFGRDSAPRGSGPATSRDGNETGARPIRNPRALNVNTGPDFDTRGREPVTRPRHDRDRGAGDLENPDHWAVVMLLADGVPRGLAQVARELDLAHPTASSAVYALAARGLVGRATIIPSRWSLLP